jgi:poly(A) polymerase Pap1
VLSFQAVEEAFVPVIKMIFDGIEVREITNIDWNLEGQRGLVVEVSNS